MKKSFKLRDEIVVHAPVERCFLLSTSVAIVQLDLGMRPVQGRTSGHVMGGDTVRWKGWQLGSPQVHVSLIEDFRPPFFFRDRMIEGRFAAFEHDHRFEPLANGPVRLADEVRFALPWGWPGALVAKLVMVPHIRGLMKRRFARLKRLAESDDWRQFLPEETGSAASANPATAPLERAR